MALSTVGARAVSDDPITDLVGVLALPVAYFLIARHYFDCSGCAG